jgi:hypothetical protein
LSNQRLDNWVAQVELAEGKQVTSSEATGLLLAQVARQVVEQPFARAGAVAALQLGLHDAVTDQPVAQGQGRIPGFSWLAPDSASTMFDGTFASPARNSRKEL